MSYDTKCFDLAEYFLKDVKGVLPEDICELAEEIQRVVEDVVATIQGSGMEEEE